MCLFDQANSRGHGMSLIDVLSDRITMLRDWLKNGDKLGKKENTSLIEDGSLRLLFN